MSFFTKLAQGLLFTRGKERVWLLPCGRNGIRVRATENAEFDPEDWAILPEKQADGQLICREDHAVVTNGGISARIDTFGKISFYNASGALLLKEYYRAADRMAAEDVTREEDRYVFRRVYGRQYRASGRGYHLSVQFEANEAERLYGMGQYQQPYLNLKGCELELAQYNTQASVPFVVSSLGYGMLWNNPAVGHVTFGKNKTEWVAESARQIDYWITAGDAPAAIVENYSFLTGTVPQMPEFGLGFWQSKLRYQTQEELLDVAREYHRRGLPLKVIVIDFFHWPHQGDWCFDSAYWPDPAAMVRELKDLGVEAMISVWPTVEKESPNFKPMLDKGLLVRADRGMPFAMDCLGIVAFSDMTNPETRSFVWEKCRQNYLTHGIRLFWLDVAEPEYTNPDFDLYRYHLGPAQETANIYPALYAKAFYDGLRAGGVENPINLVRCVWAGAQRYGALAWSGDVPSTFATLRNQVSAGLNMGMAGIPWWTSDIGGFLGGDPDDPDFRELVVRWFQFGAFSPVMRLHGDRIPHGAPLSEQRGGGMCSSGAGNEVWSFGAEAERILTRLIFVREALKPYIADAMEEAHQSGTPVIKPLFYDFPGDPGAWDVEDAYLFGHDLLVAPVTQKGQRSREVYLPGGTRWINVWDGQAYEGGQVLAAPAPLDVIPLFAREGAAVLDLIRDLVRS